MTRHFVTDRRRFGLTADALLERIARAPARGADVIQIREPDLSDLDLLVLVRRAIEVAASHGARVFVNDRVDIALASGAQGVHLRGDAPPASRVRAIVPPGFVVGRSVHSIGDADAAAADGGCDYVTFGTVFASASKPGAPAAGLERLAAVCRRSPLPVIAIGGVTAGHEPEIARAGAAGLAAVGWFM